MKYSIYGLLLIATVFFAGCSGGNEVTGKVAFPDGSPLTQGEVIFQNDQFQYNGRIQQDGTYKMVGNKDAKGIPSGKYTVYLSGTTKSDSKALDPVNAAPPKPLVADEFTARSRSPLTCDVSGSTVFDIQVKAP